MVLGSAAGSFVHSRRRFSCLTVWFSVRRSLDDMVWQLNYHVDRPFNLPCMIASHGQIRTTGLLAPCLSPRYSKPIGNNSRSSLWENYRRCPHHGRSRKRVDPTVCSLHSPRWALDFCSMIQYGSDLCQRYRSLFRESCSDVVQHREVTLNRTTTPANARIWSSLAI